VLQELFANVTQPTNNVKDKTTDILIGRLRTIASATERLTGLDCRHDFNRAIGKKENPVRNNITDIGKNLTGDKYNNNHRNF
jgi:hypothetical protein